MSDLISRKYLYGKIAELEADVRKTIVHQPKGSPEYLRCISRLNELNEFKSEVMDAPTVEAKEVVHGEWKQKTDFDADDNAIFECTNCFHGDVHAKGLEVPFCWFCGADMRKQV